MDRCARWHAACLVQSTEEQDRLDGLGTIWAGIHGPTRDLIMDGEAGLARQARPISTTIAMASSSCRGPNHIKSPQIDRSGAMLRDTMRRVITQI